MRQTGATQTERLDGFLPTAETWHAKMCLMMVGLNLNSNSFSIGYGRFEGRGKAKQLEFNIEPTNLYMYVCGHHIKILKIGW